MTPTDKNTMDSLGQDPRAQRIGELLNSFCDRRARGEDLTEERFLSEYPDYAEDLRQHISSLNLIQELGSSDSSEPTLPGDVTPVTQGSSNINKFKDSSPPLPDIPGYDVRKQIGRGGMGLVFKAVQRSTKRVVALKVLLEGPFASDVARHRFEREIALAAQLRHPNIIPIYDSGVSEGRMYYAMEHIYGLPLTDYVRAHDLSISAKLRLYIKVCDAVAHAHQKGIVHRDLKPSNVLVDGDGEPHVLDFGLAKAGSVADMTTSLTAQIVGTPAYMSPEQAVGDPGGIDTRTDVYSLGVVLYEVLTNAMPYDTSGAIGQILNHIAHTEPEPAGNVDSSIDSDLCAIVCKALEKSKDARYQSVPGLRDDLRNYLEGEPITAKPATGFYLLRKAAAKHRGALWVGFVLIVIASIAGFSIRGSMKKEAQVRVQANQLRGLEERVRQQEEENKQLQKQTASLQDERDAIVRQNNEAFDRFMASMLPSLSPEQRKPLINSFMTAGAKEKLPLITAALQQLAADFVTAGGEKRQSKKYLDDPLGAGLGDEFVDEPDSTLASDAFNFVLERFQSIRDTSPAADNSTTKPARKNDSGDGDDGAN